MNAWFLAHKDAAKQNAAKRYKENPAHTWSEEKKEKARANGRRYRRECLEIVIDHYGAKCACCGESNRDFLTIDHINNDGAKLRKIDGSGLTFYRWIIKSNYPDFFQVLCYNCNYGRQRTGGHCPHNIKKGSTPKPQPGWKPAGDRRAPVPRSAWPHRARLPIGTTLGDLLSVSRGKLARMVSAT